ncbi:MAG: S9 family peptidase [Armatimonadota bacterium]|nr:S9 family peptidase [Armatimonadota bacterium]MDR7450906.1 S9 family peptidase [Armatimonadota bacterium]MDR7465828.1 S9 family peptidase [Armatimonadota bacterium]MDR7493736.1 S9 family peptidase [Armatimonadota bacterium]MDR7498342.1 S9 family peptidase [Armatimonadota bacterium]
MPRVAPYGSWRSPITADLVASGGVVFHEIMIDGADLYWTELRPAEGGRKVIVRRSADGRVADLTVPPYNARTRVHEYGGGDFLVIDGSVYFSNFADQRLYRLDPGRSPEPLSPSGPYRYADGIADRGRRRIICVREDHSPGDQDALNTLVAVSLDDGRAQVLVEGADFYSSPRLSPDGRRLAWLSWNHPNMPWDGTELWVAPVASEGALGEARRVAGGPEESIFQPEWSPDGALHFISDRTGWWNLYRWDEGRNAAEALAPMEAEFGRPQWVFRLSTYGFIDPQTIVCAFSVGGTTRLALLDRRTRRLNVLDQPCTDLSQITPAPDAVYFIGASPTRPSSLVRLDLRTRETEVVRASRPTTVDPGYLSIPEAVEFPTAGGLTAHAWFYPPANRDFTGPPRERPPLLVISHGGPTSFSPGVLRFEIQYWTSRGFAVADVNYGGSTGYGRAYRNRLRGRWGVVDVDDCVHAARYLVERGLVDPRRLAVRGGSAGGYTTLCALAFRQVFHAGASYYGVSDLEAMHRDTHKFEAQYDQRLIGPWPERLDLYRSRSPVHFTDRITAPVIFFQGLEDRVVPPNQSEMMVEALRARGIPVAYLAFEGEQHGFRRAETIRRALEAELYFYSRIFGFTPADPIPPVRIDNLP